MSKKKLYLVFDCETCTLDFANTLAGSDAEKKKRIAIARPLIYDMGWTICDRDGNIIDKKQFLVAETFSVPSVFNTAYYKEKRPLYLEMIQHNEIQVMPWEQCISALIADMSKVDSVGAFNSMFDFKKAIPFTELYMKHLYNPDFYAWYESQKSLCQNIIDYPRKEKEDKEGFNGSVFTFRSVDYNLFDLWGLSVEHLLNTNNYKNACIQNNMLTPSGIYFKSSAESTYRYLRKMYAFDEAHTALQDAEIETYILSQIAKRHPITNGITFFPFRKLGTTNEFVLNKKPPRTTECKVVYDAIANYLKEKQQTSEFSAYLTKLTTTLNDLNTYVKESE